jgi:hypothetical protein
LASSRLLHSSLTPGIRSARLRFEAGGVDVDALAVRLQTEGADAFVDSWDELIANIGEKASVLTAAS